MRGAADLKICRMWRISALFMSFCATIADVDFCPVPCAYMILVFRHATKNHFMPRSLKPEDRLNKEWISCSNCLFILSFFG